MTVEFGPKPLPLLPPLNPTPATEAAAKPAASAAPAAASPAVVLGLSAGPRPAPPALPPQALPPQALPAAAAPALAGAGPGSSAAAPPLLQQAHLNLAQAELLVARPRIPARPGQPLPPQDEAAALIVKAATQLIEGLRGASAPEGEERRSLAILRTFLGQAQDPDGLPMELLLPATLKEVREHLEAWMRRVGLPLLDPSQPGLRRNPQGDWAWVADLAGEGGAASTGRLLWMALVALVLVAGMLLALAWTR